MDVAVFGGSFDPPHIGHVLAVAYMLSAEAFDRVLVVPVLAHAFEKRLAEYPHRVAMTRLAMQPLGDVEVSTVEETLGSPSRTLRTVEHLVAAHPDWKLRLVIGADVYQERSKWFGFDELERIAPPLVLGRAGSQVPGAPAALLPDVSSTRVRHLLAAPRDHATNAELGTLVPHSVLTYIDRLGLYR